MISIQWGSEEQRLADSLIKEATQKQDISQSIRLIEKAILVFENDEYYIKLSNYLLKNGQIDQSINILLSKIAAFKKSDFDFMAIPDMKISMFYGHLGTQMNRLKMPSKSVYYQTLSVLYLSIPLSVQQREDELNDIFDGARSQYFGEIKFWKPFFDAKLDKSLFSNWISDILLKMREDLFLIIDRVKLLNKDRVAHEEQLTQDHGFWSAYNRLKSIDFETETLKIIRV